LVHEGHRKRLKERFLREGLDSFEQHQVLELLLFFSIPRKDTNELAHTLLNRYGSLSGVFEADPKDLATTPGIGENSAILLSLIPIFQGVILMISGGTSPSSTVRQKPDNMPFRFLREEIMKFLCYLS